MKIKLLVIRVSITILLLTIVGNNKNNKRNKTKNLLVSAESNLNRLHDSVDKNFLNKLPNNFLLHFIERKFITVY